MPDSSLIGLLDGQASWTAPLLLERFVQSERSPADGPLGGAEVRQLGMQPAKSVESQVGLAGSHQEYWIGRFGAKGRRLDMFAVQQDRRARSPLEREPPEQAGQQARAMGVTEDVPGVVKVVGTEDGRGVRT